METHFEGSRGSEHTSSPHQRQYDEQNPDNANVLDSDHQKDQNEGESDSVDSPINTSEPTEKNGGSLTNDESANTDPNAGNKPEFRNNNDKK